MRPLRIDTSFHKASSHSPTSPSSLFSVDVSSAERNAPPIPGLYFNPTVHLPKEVSDLTVDHCMNTYFQSPEINQIMLFGQSGIIGPLNDLLGVIADVLRPVIPHDVHELLFPVTPTRVRQAILNLYRPGEGITPHVDLLNRFADGIVGVSLQGGCVMRFAQESQSASHDLYLPPRSLIVLTEDARYDWTHEIPPRVEDWVKEGEDDSVCIPRDVRLSVTFRWLLAGAEIVGED